jgi:5-methylcytosine-specific restriction endonuclease McrA
MSKIRNRPTAFTYQVYIRSSAWLQSTARLEELRLSGHRCRLCSRGRPHTRLQVHHSTYARLGHERPADLCALCEECHIGVTDMLRRRRYRRRRALPLSDVRVLVPERRLTDSVLEGL